MHPPARVLLRRVFRTIVLGGIASAILLAVLSWAAVSFLRQALGRIEIAPVAFSRMMHESVLATFREGTSQQKQDLIAAFAEAPAESIAAYRPQFQGAAKDPDPGVSRAARQALGRINPAEANP